MLFILVLILLYLILGLIAAIALLVYVSRLSVPARHKMLGRALVIAAIIYPLMALYQEQYNHLLVETSGVFAYGLFYLLSLKFAPFWLAIGWLLHPIWDGVLHLYGPIQEVAPSWYAWACLSFDILVGGYCFTLSKPETSAVKP